MGGRVTFRDSALNDLRRHDHGCLSLEPPSPPIRAEVAVAIVQKLGPFQGFDALLYPVVAVHGEVRPVKRCLVDVRSKRFVVFVARGVIYDTLAKSPYFEKSRQLERWTSYLP